MTQELFRFRYDLTGQLKSRAIDRLLPFLDSGYTIPPSLDIRLVFALFLKFRVSIEPIVFLSVGELS